MVDVGNAIGTAVSITKRLFEIATFVKDAEAKLLIAELTMELANVKTDVAELVDKNRELAAEVKDLKQLRTIRGQLRLENNMLFRVDGETRSGPYCVRCEASERMVAMISVHGWYICPHCEFALSTNGGPPGEEVRAYTRDIFGEHGDEPSRRS